jgi:hypothetical protein
MIATVNLWIPQIREHKLVIVDDFGRVARVRFRVGEE